MKPFILATWLVLSPLALFAGPPPGSYELYNTDGQKTGTITSELKTDKANRHLETKTTLIVPGMSTDYRFTENDVVDLDQHGVVSFRRENDENGKKSLFIGVRRGQDLVVNYERDGNKFSTSFSSGSYDLTEFEMELPGSGFRTIKPGQSKTLRVLFFDRMDIVPVSRNVAPAQTLPYNDRKVPIEVATTLIKGKPTTSWFHAKTGELLQEDGTTYVMSRIEKN